MTTAADIIARALRKAGVTGQGQTASAEDTNDAFADLNDLIAQWRRKRWLIYHLVDISCVSTGAVSYGVGPGQSFNVARPDRLEAAFVRMLTAAAPNQVDYPLRVLQAREDYNLIAMKQQGSMPAAVFYDSGWPNGTLYPWPVPQAGIYEVHITLKADLPAFATTADAVSLPPEYEAALMWNLCKRLRPSYQLPPDAEVTQQAKDSLNVIRNANTQIPRLGMPATLGTKPTGYNPYSDQGG